MRSARRRGRRWRTRSGFGRMSAGAGWSVRCLWRAGSIPQASSAVPEFEVGELAGAGVGGERGIRPSMSVMVSWAPGWGRSLRMMTCMPAGQPVRSSSPVSSATQAPSRGILSAS